MNYENYTTQSGAEQKVGALKAAGWQAYWIVLNASWFEVRFWK